MHMCPAEQLLQTTTEKDQHPEGQGIPLVWGVVTAMV